MIHNRSKSDLCWRDDSGLAVAVADVRTGMTVDDDRLIAEAHQVGYLLVPDKSFDTDMVGKIKNIIVNFFKN